MTRAWSLRTEVAGWVPKWSVPAAMRAIRAMVCVCGLFALSDKVIGNPQIATFAAFGSFATLVLASFAGTWRDKLLAHLALALTGSVLLTIATIVSSSTVLAAIVTVPVTFAVFFAGVTGPNAASGATGALLAWVLPAASAGTISMVPDRLIGWWMASVCGTALVLLFSPRSTGGSQLNTAASALAGKLADVLDAAVRGGADQGRSCGDGHGQARLDRPIHVDAIPPHRPGCDRPGARELRRVARVDRGTDLRRGRGAAQPEKAPEPDLELIAVSSSVLRDTASLFSGGDARPDIDELERCRAAVLSEIENSSPRGTDFQQAAQISFHVNAVAVAVLGVAYEAMIASRLADPEWLEARRARWYTGTNAAARTLQRVSSVATAAHTHASLRSVWFVNSLRGAVALAVAVAVADVTTVQHGFWVVLGTLSVLRTNASATGATAVRAIAGTAIGFVIGGALVLAIGSDETALWIVFPFAVLVAAYSPGTAPFAVGQAAFTVLIAILFNLIVPVGWKVGVVRIEDVALGCAVSAVIGTLFWPRGVSSVVGDDLADAFRTGASYLTQAVQWATGARADEPDAASPAGTVGARLDEGLRGFLSEQGSKRIAKQDLWRLVGGSLRLRLTAHAVAEMPGDATGVQEARAVLERRTATLASWYDELAEQVGRPNQRAVSELQPPSLAAAGIVDESSGSYYGVWLCEHLDHLSQHTVDLVRPAAAVANLRRRPWWR